VNVEPPVISLLDGLKAPTPSALGRKRAVSIMGGKLSIQE
jgi:hypothetical protein